MSHDMPTASSQPTDIPGTMNKSQPRKDSADPAFVDAKTIDSWSTFGFNGSQSQIRQRDEGKEKAPASIVHKPGQPAASLLTAAVNQDRREELHQNPGPWSGMSPPAITAAMARHARYDSVVQRFVALKPCRKIHSLSYENLEHCAYEETSRALRILLSAAESAITTPAALDEVYQDAHRPSGANDPFRIIGQGYRAKVFQRLHKDTVIKLANSEVDNAPLWEEYRTLTAINHHLVRYAHLGLHICVPRVYNYFGPDSMAHMADNNNKSFRDHARLRGWLGVDTPPLNDSFVMERILPVHSLIRTSIINHFGKASPARQLALNSPNNIDILLRVYLGKAKSRVGTKPQWDSGMSIHDYPLYVNDLESWSVDCHGLAEAMGQTLAILHWAVGVDGSGVKFVLGSPRRDGIEHETYNLQQIDSLPSRSTTRVALNNCQSAVKLWVMDFDSVEKVRFAEEPMNREELEESEGDQDPRDTINRQAMTRLVDTFFASEPWYPRPLVGNHYQSQLWTAFKDEYLRVARAVRADKLDGEVLPLKFINKIVSRQRRQLEQTRRRAPMPDPMPMAYALQELEIARETSRFDFRVDIEE